MGLNSVQLVGRLAKDAQIKYSQNGVSIANFVLCVDRDYKNKDGSKQTDFIPCTVIGKDKINDWLLKGKLVAIQGSIQVDRWQDKNGTWQTYTKVVTKDIQFLDKKNTSVEAAEKAEFQAVNDDDMPF